MPTAMITGATAGLGAAFARRLASDGFDLILVARNGERLAETAGELERTYRTGARTVVADLASDAGMETAEDVIGGADVDLLINNAGFGNRGRFPDAPIKDELAMLRLHCEAVLRLTHAAVPGMLAGGRGGVINVASVAAFFARGTYSASKAWVVNFSQSVMQDIGGQGVHVMALCPGFVHTEFHERAQMDMSEVPDALWLDAGEVAATALRDLRRGIGVSIPGAQYKTIVGVGRHLPFRLSAKAGRLSSRTGRSGRK